jgi:ABC-type transport system involved in multi-copper enzyme maturation permease subunit
LLLTPAFPATTLVREKIKGTLPLLLNSPLRPVSIYVGKLGGVLGFAAVLLVMTLPAAAACHVLGGAASRWGIPALYAILAVAALQTATLGLLVSSRANSTVGTLLATYGLVLATAVFTLGPYWLLRGGGDFLAGLANFIPISAETLRAVSNGLTWLSAVLRGLSPIPAVMEVLGQGDVGTGGISSGPGAAALYLILAPVMSLACALATVLRLNHKLLDKARPAGVMTQDRTTGQQVLRRVVYLVDPQRRAGGIGWWVNPVMAKEFRSRRFGRWHWTLRLVSASAILSLAVSVIGARGALGWGTELIGGGLVLLQVALLILFAPSLGAGLVSAERETGSWTLLRMTPLSPGRILRGKLMSVVLPLLLLLCATLPGYAVLMMIEPATIPRIGSVAVCLALTAVFILLVSAAAGALFRSTAAALTASYVALLAVCLGPLLVRLALNAPFGLDAVRAALLIDPVAAALEAADAGRAANSGQATTPGWFEGYDLLPANWWIIGGACVALLAFLRVRVWQLYRPE